MKASRAPLGKVASRKLKTATYKTSLRGAPEGKYVVIRFNSSFENEKEVIEICSTRTGSGESRDTTSSDPISYLLIWLVVSG